MITENTRKSDSESEIDPFSFSHVRKNLRENPAGLTRASQRRPSSGPASPTDGTSGRGLEKENPEAEVVREKHR